MTVQEINALAKSLEPLVTTLRAAVSELDSFIGSVEQATSEANIFAGTINADLFIQIEAPVYLELLRRIEVAADAFGTDILNP